MNTFDYLFLIFLALTTLFVIGCTTTPFIRRWLSPTTTKAIFWSGIVLTCISNFLGKALQLHW